MKATESTNIKRDIPFEEDAEEVLTKFRTALSDIVSALPETVYRPQELTRALGVDKKLGWKIANVIHSPDPFEIAQHVPGRSGLKIFLAAAKKKNVPGERLEGVREAMREYERLIDVHAGDRATLEMMLTSRAKRGRDRVDLEHRRAAFRANSYIWGIQAKTQFRTYFLYPSSDELFDIVSVRGYVGLRRIRAGVPWAIHRARVVDDDGVQRREVQSEWLDPPEDGDESYGVPLIREFCTKPLPKMRRVITKPGLIDYEIIEGQVGNKAMGTCVMGDLVRGAASRYGGEHHACVELAARVITPCENLLFDQIIHEDLFDELDPKLTVYSELAGETPPSELAEARLPLPVFEEVALLGKGSSTLHAAETPRYSEMMQFVFKRLGLDSRKFNVYRVHMTFPPIPTAAVVSMQLPKRK